MQAIARHRTLAALRTSSPIASPSSLIRQSQSTTRRTFATKTEESNPTDAPKPQSGARGPLLAVAAVLTFFPSYYWFHSGKPPRSEHAAIQEARRNSDPAKEYRDPRDSEVKTPEQKRAKEEREGSEG